MTLAIIITINIIIIVILINIIIIIVWVISVKASVVSLFISSTLRWGSNCLLVGGGANQRGPCVTLRCLHQGLKSHSASKDFEDVV